MTTDVYRALIEQRQNQLSKGWRTNVEIDGYRDFVFSTKNRNPIMPSAVNNLLDVREWQKLELTQTYCSTLWVTARFLL